MTINSHRYVIHIGTSFLESMSNSEEAYAFCRRDSVTAYNKQKSLSLEIICCLPLQTTVLTHQYLSVYVDGFGPGVA
jgi:hypothetical protein